MLTRENLAMKVEKHISKKISFYEIIRGMYRFSLKDNYQLY